LTFGKVYGALAWINEGFTPVVIVPESMRPGAYGTLKMIADKETPPIEVGVPTGGGCRRWEQQLPMTASAA
jgi:hypothetical protein